VVDPQRDAENKDEAQNEDIERYLSLTERSLRGLAG
jgi:hypothetical protein